MTLAKFFEAIGIELNSENKAKIYLLGLAKFDTIRFYRSWSVDEEEIIITENDISKAKIIKE